MQSLETLKGQNTVTDKEIIELIKEIAKLRGLLKSKDELIERLKTKLISHTNTRNENEIAGVTNDR